jgi:hypothetical protein
MKRKRSKIDIEQGINNLKNETVKQKAIKYVNSDRLYIFWFKTEESSVSSIVDNYGSGELKFVYGSLSMSAHAGHLGMLLFKDNPDDISIDPSENPKKTKFAIIASCRLLLELLYIRIVYEKLGYDTEYDDFLKRILAFEDEVRG